jgi:hypothetical protein
MRRFLVMRRVVRVTRVVHSIYGEERLRDSSEFRALTTKRIRF